MRLKKQLGNRVVALLVGAVLIGAAGGFTADAQAAAFDVKRLVICKDVQNREPVDASDTFSADTPKVYAFLEAVNISADTDIGFVWYHGENEMLRVTVPVRQGGRWRTYANKNLYGLTGAWRVEIQAPDGAVIGAIGFEVK